MDRIKGYGYAEVMRLRGRGYIAPHIGLRGRGYIAPHIGGHAHETADVDILTVAKYLRVTPTEPQMVVWVVPGNELTYQVESNTNWDIK